MARIPTYISEERVGGGVPEGAGRIQVTPEQMGAGIGVAQQQLGAAMIGTGVAIGNLAEDLGKKQDKLETANAIGKFDFSRTFSEMQTKAAADGKDFQLNVANAYDQTVDNYINGLGSSEKVRADVRIALLAQRSGYVKAAQTFTDRALDANDKIDSNAALDIQQNIVRRDASIGAYDQAVEKSHAIIDAQPGATAVQKLGQKQATTHILGKRRFEGMIEASEHDPIALEGVRKELDSDTWKRRLSGQDYDKLLDSVDQKMKAANTAEATAGRAAIQNVRQRTNDGVEIDPVELKAATVAVMASNRPELISQMAMINKQQEIYRNGKNLPLAEQRVERDKAMNAKGIAALPEPVKNGIAAGVAATNGTIGQEFLAGLVNAEYGHKLGSGDYGQPTENRNGQGQRGSDAIGVAQFTGPTFLNTVNAHRSELGVAAGLTDAQILEKRKDPEFAIKAAALHALDNKTALEGELGRPVTDSDLYFAHFLGVAGARRFLTAADAKPSGIAKDNVGAAQVDANKNVFYDNVTGKPRTNEQVRAYMTQAMMNGPSRVDWAGVKAWDKTIINTEKGLRENPMGFARTVQRFADIGDLSTPEGVQRRGVVAAQVAEYYGAPTRSFKPLLPEEVETLSKTVRDGSADETLQVMGTVAGLGGDMAKAAFKQLGEKDTVFGYAAGLATTAGQPGVASDIIRGEKRLRDDKDVLTTIGLHENEIVAEFAKQVGKSVLGTELGTQIRKAAVAHYVETALVRGSAKAGRFDTVAFGDSINAVLGGDASPDKKAIGNVNGAQTMLPKGVTAEQFTTALSRMTSDDYARLSKWGGPPLYSDGKTASARDIANEGRFEAIGAGEYRIKMGDGSYLLSGVATMPDGKTKRAVPYIFQGDPAALAEFANRPGAERSPIEPGRLE